MVVVVDVVVVVVFVVVVTVIIVVAADVIEVATMLVSDALLVVACAIAVDVSPKIIFTRKVSTNSTIRNDNDLSITSILSSLSMIETK